jgi:uncharacterized membrane protein YhiD involved in acid resistance
MEQNLVNKKGDIGIVVASVALSIVGWFLPLILGYLLWFVAFLLGIIGLMRNIKSKEAGRIIFSVVAIGLPVLMFLFFNWSLSIIR